MVVWDFFHQQYQIPPPKFNSSPLKSYRAPIGSRIVFQPPFFRGELLNLHCKGKSPNWKGKSSSKPFSCNNPINFGGVTIQKSVPFFVGISPVETPGNLQANRSREPRRRSLGSSGVENCDPKKAMVTSRVDGRRYMYIYIYWIVVSNIFYFHPETLGKFSNLTNIFQNGLKPTASIYIY